METGTQTRSLPDKSAQESLIEYGMFLKDLILTDHIVQGSFAGAFILILIILMYLRRRRKTAQNKLKLQRLAPFVSFFRELCSQPLSERKFFSLFAKESLEKCDRAVVRSMARCSAEELGDVKRIILHTAKLQVRKEREGSQLRFSGESLLDFEKVSNVHCKLVWLRGPDDRASIVSFHVKPPGGSLNIMDHANYKDFDMWGEKFVHHLLSRKPTFAINHMTPSLRKKFEGEGEALLCKDTLRVIRRMGGFKNKEVDIGLSDGRLIKVGDDAKQFPAIELDYIVLGEVADVKVQLVIVVSGLKCCVLRYRVEALPNKQKTVVVDQETGSAIAGN